METRYDKFELFKNSLSSLKETSKDSDSKEISYMTESDLQVVNFDKVIDKIIGYHFQIATIANFIFAI